MPLEIQADTQLRREKILQPLRGICIRNSPQ